MKALFVGLGSIGQRHLANLCALCEKEGIALEVAAWRSSLAPLPEAAAQKLDAQYTKLPTIGTYDVAFITNPTHLHAGALRNLVGRVGTYFIEKPIFEKPYDLNTVGLGKGQKAYVAAPMRFCGLYPALKEAVQQWPVYSVRVLCSSYLPGWRPGRDYSAGYSAHKDMGGGVALDLIHEWDYLVDLFGLPQEWVMMQGKFSSLAIDSNDLALYMARYPGFLCEVHLDYFGRRYRRTLEVFSEAGSLVADFGSGQLHLPDGSIQEYVEDINRRYEREMAYFLGYARGEETQSINSPERALEVLKIAAGE